jgi:hypothetical protein
VPLLPEQVAFEVHHRGELSKDGVRLGELLQRAEMRPDTAFVKQGHLLKQLWSDDLLRRESPSDQECVLD